ncbi:hypothetical protein RD792_002022 [Penstemon davidsonii]|uniref:Fibronectin type III-like domain-containing protein n=1 Tax=Penstemon davidsonii TaxID=160366 RepID=A0ABR0DQM0_9LAMI|nr:hypothetical protein RD792_002022 [Penstemon davidsonii]
MAPAKYPLLLFLICFTITIPSNFIPVFSENKPIFACDISKNRGLRSLKFCDQSLDVKTRVADLVSRLTLEEKIGWMSSTSKGTSRLGIPDYQWWSEALHGVAGSPGTRFSSLVPGATSFPQTILTAATFNILTFEAIGKVVSTEARDMYNVGLTGLTFWAPNVNIFRDPRWGRGQETPGEDPALSSLYATAYVRGLQQRDDGDINRLKVAACCKHYTAYDLDFWKGIERYNFNAVVLNQVNGKPTCGDPDLLSGVIRGQWNLNGYIVSDCDSLEKMFSSQHYTKTPEETAALAVNSGMDLNCDHFISSNALAAVHRGLLNETSINRAISNNFATMMRLGFFDGDPSKQLYGNLGPKDICTEENQEFAREVARQGIVLLKNSENSLPLSPTAIKTLAVIGPNANATETMIGNYAGTPCRYTSPLEGLTESVPTIYDPGCINVFCKAARIDDAKRIAASEDAVVLFMGSDQSIERETVDRVDITLSGQQQLLVSEVAKVSKGPVILVIMSGGGMDVQFAKDDPKITSILWVGFPGEAGGAAISDIIFGYRSPSGTLPMTWYPQSYTKQVEMTNMNMRADPKTGYPGRTYRFYKGPTVFPFGHGLTYSEFSHNLVDAPKLVSVLLEEGHVCLSSKCKSIDALEETCKNLAFDIHLRVKNVGKMRASHTVLLFSSPPQVHNSPQKQLLGFEKLHLMPEEEGMVRFNVHVCKHLSLVDENGHRKIALGQYVLRVGSLTHFLNVGIRLYYHGNK